MVSLRCVVPAGAVAGLAALLSMTGCSFAFVKGPAAASPGAAPACTSTVVWPVTDTALAAASAVVGTREALRTDVDGYTEGFRRGLMIASAVSVVAWAFSAYHGYTLSADCRRARTLQTSLMATPRR